MQEFVDCWAQQERGPEPRQSDGWQFSNGFISRKAILVCLEYWFVRAALIIYRVLVGGATCSEATN